MDICTWKQSRSREATFLLLRSALCTSTQLPPHCTQSLSMCGAKYFMKPNPLKRSSPVIFLSAASQIMNWPFAGSCAR